MSNFGLHGFPGAGSLSGYGSALASTVGQLTVTSVPLGGYAEVFSSGDAYKAVGSVIQRSLYPEMSSAYPRQGWLTATTSTLPLFSGSKVSYSALAYANGQFVAVTGQTSSPSTGAAISRDGKSWTQTVMPTSMEWRAMAFGAGLYVAIGTASGNVATAQYATSPDGINWTARNMGVSGNWGAITYSPVLGLFVAVSGGANGVSTIAATSPDGLAWTARTLPTSSYWQSVCASPTGVLVAVGGLTNSTGPIATSTNGTAWTGRTLPNGTATSVAYGNGLFVSVGMLGVATSPDGVNWTPRAVPGNWDATRVAYGNGLFVALGSNLSTAAFTSPDGIIWTAFTIVAQTLPGSLAYGGGTFLLTAGINDNGAILLYSENTTDSDYMYIGGTAGKYVRVR